MSQPRLAALFSLGLLALLLGGATPAQDKKDDGKKEAPEKLVETHHVLQLGKENLEYKATAGRLTLHDHDGKATAHMFFIAYTKPNVPDPTHRPLLFAFNGGPGSSSVWLHMGAFGPKRVKLKEDGHGLRPPGELVPNEFTLLDLADLVFIDPVGTGYSRPAHGVEGKRFYGVQQDVQSVGEFIRLYCTRFDRWKSPKFIAGESYGTTRAALLSSHLQDRLGMNLNGVILISAILNFQTARFDEGNDLPYALFLPTFTATAWYHKKLTAELQSDLRRTLDEVEDFAAGEYTLALTRGSKMSDEERNKVRGKLARFTGLSEDYVERSNLRIDAMRFMKELLRGEKRTVGRYDSRFLGIDLDAVGERHEYDASYTAVQGPYTAMLNQYMRTELNYDTDLQYEILTGRVQPWDFGPAATNRFLNAAPSLRQALTHNPDLRVLLCSGYYDLATPYFGSDYTFDHLGLAPNLRKHVTTAYFHAGHMMYIHQPSHRKLREDIANFLKATLAP
jgi:carboxypeptidase C (cathepsin A)